MDVEPNHLAYYLDRIHKFLTSNGKTQVFPSLTMGLEDVLMNIAKDVGYLKNEWFNDKCSRLADQIAGVLESNKKVFKLTYGFDTDEHGNRLMVYKKTTVPETKESASLKVLRKPHIMQHSSKLSDMTNKITVMSSFKIACLNATLKFVKNDQRVLQYPDMSTEQAEFIKQMIEQCMNPIETSDTGFKGLYDSLTEALKIFSLKYDFKLGDSVPIHNDMKRLFFEKIPILNKTNEKTDDEIPTISPSPLHEHDKPESNTNHRNPEITHRKIPEFCYNMVNTENAMEIDKNNLAAIPTAEKKEKETKMGNNVRKDTEFDSKLLNSMPSTNQIKENKEILQNDFITKRDYSTLTVEPVNTSKKTRKKLRLLMAAIIQLKSAFAENAITLLRNFLSNNAKNKIVFSDLNTDEIIFLKQWDKVVHNLEIIRMFCSNGQIMLYEINTLMTQMSSKYQLNISTTETSVTFTKHPKQNQTQQQTQIKNKEDIHSMSNTSISSNNSSKSSKSIKKETGKKTKETKPVTELWIKSKMAILKDFINDDAQASLIIPGVTEPQVVFLRNWRKISSDAYVVDYCADIQRILKDVHQSMFRNALSFTVSVDVTKEKKGDGQTRNIKFTKLPCFATPLPKAEEKSPKKNVPAKSAPKDDGNKVAKPAKVNSTESLKKNELASDKNKVQKTGNAVIANSSNARIIPKSSSTSSLRSGNTTVDRGRPNSASVSTNSARAKAKLIEGLSQPLVSEKGLKMMRVMGWEGGALGARGDGIVEPIALSLDQGKRAGLGLKTPPSKQDIVTIIKSLPADIMYVSLPLGNHEYSAVLRTVMTMLESREFVTELSFPSKITQKRWNFVRNLVNTCNSRAKLAFESPSMTEMGNTIIGTISQTDLILTACLGISKRNILFVLSNSVYKPSDCDSENWISVINIENSTKKIINVVANNIKDGPAFRCYIMTEILDFCQQSKSYKQDRTKDIHLKDPMTAKQISFINDLLIRLNGKTRASTDNEIEISIYEDVKSKIEGFILDVEFPLQMCTDENRPPVYKIVRLYKIYTYYTSKTKTPNKSSDKPKIEVRSVNSINRLQSDQTVIKDIEITKSIVTTNSVNEVTSVQDTILEYVNENLQNKLKNIEKVNKAKRRTTFTSDTFEEKCLFENFNASMVIQDEQTDIKDDFNAPIDDKIDDGVYNSKDDDFNENLQNKLKNIEKVNKAKRRTTFTSDTFDEKCLFENFNASMVIQDEQTDIKDDFNALIDDKIDDGVYNSKDNDDFNENPQNKLKNIEKENKANRRTTFTSDTFDEKCLFENFNESMVIQDELTDIKDVNFNAPIDDNIDDCVYYSKDKDNLNDKDVKINEIDRQLVIGNNLKKTERHKRNCLTATDTKNDNENDMATFSENDGITLNQKGNKNDRTIVTENDKDNYRATLIENDKENEINREQNTRGIDASTSMTAANFDVDQSLQNLRINKLTSLTSADSHIECAEHSLKELVTQNGCDLLLSKQLDVNINENETIDKENPYRQIEYNIGKRFRSNVGTPEHAHKKCKHEFEKKIGITPKNYPHSNMTNKMAGDIQKSILTSIDYTAELPLLKCHGIQDGALTYSCHTEKSFDLIKKVVKKHDLQITTTQKKEQIRHQMTIRINTFIEENIDIIFERLESYNINLDTKDWKVIAKDQSSDILVIYVDIDEYSYNVIVKNKFTLYAGMDEARFSIDWV